MPAHSDRRNRKSLLRDLFAELTPERQAVELEVLGEIHRLAQKSVAETVPDSSREGVAAEILEIMKTYREQEASQGGLGTPGGLEHMGDVWRLFRKWEEILKG